MARSGEDNFDFYNIFKVRHKYGISYQNIAFLGFLSLVLIYRNLNFILIPIKHMAIIGLIGSVLVTILFLEFYKNNLTLIWALFHNLTIGLVFVGLFVWTNDKLSTSPVTEEVYRIENVDLNKFHKQRMQSVLKPVVTVNVHGIMHKMVYNENEFKPIMKSKKVQLSLKKGYWGYWIIQNTKLL